MPVPLLHRLMKPQADGSPSVPYLYSRLSHYLRPYWFRVIMSLLLTIPIGSLDATIALSLKPFMDSMQVKDSVGNANYVPFLIVGLTAIQGVLQYFSIYLNGWLSFHITSNIRRDLFQKLLSMDVQYFDRTPSGSIIQRYFKDPEALQMNLFENTKQMLTRFFTSLFLIGALIYTSWQLSITAISILLLILYPSTHIRKIIKNLARDLTHAGGQIMSLYTETAGGIKVIDTFNMQKTQLHKFNQVQRSMYDRVMKKAKSQGWLQPSMHIIASIGIAAIIWQGSRMAVAGEITTGALVSFIAALIMLYNPIKNLGGSMMNAQLSLLAAGRIFDLMDTQPTIADRPDARPLKGLRKSICFEDVTFRYRGTKGPVFAGFNLTIHTGETLALVGSSGSGKTTIANLIPRFYDVLKGAIRIDGVDIRDFTLESLRRNIAIVMQDSFLFDGSIRDNILIGNPKATTEELYDAVEKAYLTEFLQSLTEEGTIEAGLDSHIGERGVMLSGGQRQRVSIARALLKKAPIVILDEATSALDNQSEAIVQKAIESLMKDRTVIIIAHRLSTIRNADRIVVLEQGKILEEGTHESLLAAEGTYTMLYNTQFKSLEDIALPQETTSASEPALITP